MLANNINRGIAHFPRKGIAVACVVINTNAH
jgi:hypothetical protein